MLPDVSPCHTPMARVDGAHLMLSSYCPVIEVVSFQRQRDGKRWLSLGDATIPALSAVRHQYRRVHPPASRTVLPGAGDGHDMGVGKIPLGRVPVAGSGAK